MFVEQAIMTFIDKSIFHEPLFYTLILHQVKQAACMRCVLLYISFCLPLYCMQIIEGFNAKFWKFPYMLVVDQSACLFVHTVGQIMIGMLVSAPNVTILTS